MIDPDQGLMFITGTLLITVVSCCHARGQPNVCRLSPDDISRPRQTWSRLLSRLQLLVLELALQLLGLGHLAHCFVEVVLIDRVPIVLDGKQTAS